jgi:hypothetical protein
MVVSTIGRAELGHDDDDDDVALWSQENNKREGRRKMENPKIEGRQYGTVFECNRAWSLSKSAPKWTSSQLKHSDQTTGWPSTATTFTSSAVPP